MPKAFQMVVTADELTPLLKKLGAMAQLAIARAVNDIADDIMGDAKEITPVRDFAEGGYLRRSAFVDYARPGPKAWAVIGYRAIYAEAVHENARAGHTRGLSPSGERYKHWAKVGRWHFLEAPFKRAQRTFRSDVSRIIRADWAHLL